MTGFAQRLVARSAGQPAGLPLLMPRPASRFETSDPPVHDEVTETTAPAQVTRPSSDLAGARIAERPQERLAESPGAEASRHENSLPEQRLQSEALPSRSSATPPDRGLPVASSRAPERADIEAGQPAREIPLPANITRMAEPSTAFADRAMAAPFTPAMTANEAKVERSAAPQISIGRIEVQFLAPERPVAAPRAEPQRTRGFDAYARARRGMPR